MSRLNFIDRFGADTFPDENVNTVLSNQLDKDDGWFNVAGVVDSQHITKDIMNKALSLPDEYGIVKKHALMNPRYKEFYPNGHE